MRFVLLCLLYLLQATESFFTRAPQRSPPPVVILPGFGNDAVDYVNPLDQGEEESFAYALRRRGFSVTVLPVKRTDWLKFASGMMTREFYDKKMTPSNPSYRWYLDSTVRTVEEVAQQEGRKVVLLAHSAGGWLARAALNNGTWPGLLADDASELVKGIVTLGSPHSPPDPPSEDMTRGALTYVHQRWPGAYLKDKGIAYTTVCGTAIMGSKVAERRTPASFAFRSYMSVCGRGEESGDGVVPLCSAHLTGAQQISLPGVYHSIGSQRMWYGADAVVDQWLTKISWL